MAALSMAWVATVIEPDILTTMAHWVGVGRGTDLLLYALVVVVLMLGIGIHKRFVRLEDRVVQLTRELAIAEAHRADRDHEVPTSG